MLTLTITGDGLVRLHQAVKALGEQKARVAYSRAINHTGRVAGTETGRALADQTGLPKSTGRKAVTRKVDRSQPSTLTYTIHGKGGDVSLRYFKPRETRKGVTASPWNKRQLYPSSFMRAGWWPKRVSKQNWNSQVFRRTGIVKKTDAHPGGMDQFEKVKSGLFVPTEMVRGEVAATWNRSAQRLQRRVVHEVRRVTKGVVT